MLDGVGQTLNAVNPSHFQSHPSLTKEACHELKCEKNQMKSTFNGINAIVMNTTIHQLDLYIIGSDVIKHVSIHKGDKNHKASKELGLQNVKTTRNTPEMHKNKTYGKCRYKVETCSLKTTQ